ncbi:MAG: shikimate kinase [Actinomycetota bacterium]
MPGAGKTTVGAALAQLMQWGFVDIDDVVAHDVGDIAAFIEANGIEAFRAQERTALEAVTGAIRAAAAPSSVVSVGGGAVLDSANRAVLRATGPVVWLRATVDTLRDHVGDGVGRPLLAGDAAAALGRMRAEREPLYASTANHTVDVDGLDPNEVAVEIVKAIAS